VRVGVRAHGIQIGRGAPGRECVTNSRLAPESLGGARNLWVLDVRPPPHFSKPRAVSELVQHDPADEAGEPLVSNRTRDSRDWRIRVEGSAGDRQRANLGAHATRNLDAHQPDPVWCKNSVDRLSGCAFSILVRAGIKAPRNRGILSGCRQMSRKSLRLHRFNGGGGSPGRTRLWGRIPVPQGKYRGTSLLLTCLAKSGPRFPG
jgi:hypothetical protein